MLSLLIGIGSNWQAVQQGCVDADVRHCCTDLEAGSLGGWAAAVSRHDSDCTSRLSCSASKPSSEAPISIADSVLGDSTIASVV